jgi:hypothetical protein
VKTATKRVMFFLKRGNSLGNWLMGMDIGKTEFAAFILGRGVREQLMDKIGG